MWFGGRGYWQHQDQTPPAMHSQFPQRLRASFLRANTWSICSETIVPLQVHIQGVASQNTPCLKEFYLARDASNSSSSITALYTNAETQIYSWTFVKWMAIFGESTHYVFRSHRYTVHDCACVCVLCSGPPVYYIVSLRTHRSSRMSDCLLCTPWGLVLNAQPCVDDVPPQYYFS